MKDFFVFILWMTVWLGFVVGSIDGMHASLDDRMGNSC